MTNLEHQKLIAEIAAIKTPWFARIETWVAIVAIFSSMAGLAFQYSLHDSTLLIARAEKALALDEKIKAENEKYLVTRERIALSEKLESFHKELKSLIDEHNKLIATTVPDAKQVKAIVEANYRFLESIKKKQTQVEASVGSPQKEIHYFSWVDQVLSSIISLFSILLGLYIVYWFMEKRQPELMQLAKDFLKRQGKDGEGKS